MNIGVLMFFQISVLCSFRYSSISGSKCRSIFIFFEVSLCCFPQWLLQQSAFPPTVQKGSPFSTSSPALVVCWFIDDSHSHRCEMVSHVVLICISLMISDHWASFHMSMGHMCGLFGEVSIQVLCPFFKLDCLFLWCWVLCYLWILDINPLSDVSGNMFFHSMGYLFILLMFSFAVQKYF